MTRNARFYFKVIVSVFLACVIFAYAFYQSKNLRQGPVIIIESPANGMLATSSPVIIRGKVLNISSISLNDRPIFVDEQGTFSEEVFPLVGQNIWKLEAQDKFKRKIMKILEVVYKP